MTLRSFGGRRAVALAITLTSLAVLQPGTARAQSPGRDTPTTGRRFDLFAIVDFAATGMRSTGAYRFYVSNSGPMDAQSGALGSGPAAVQRGTTFFNQFLEVSLFATAAAGDRLNNLGRAPSLGNVSGAGQALSYSYHFLQPGISHWRAADGSLGFLHSGRRSTADGTCLQHTPMLAAGVPLMAGSDCPATWGIDGWQGRYPIPQVSWQTVFNQDKPNFRFNFWEVPLPLQDTTRFLGDRFSTFGVTNDYSRERKQLFGSVIPGGAGSPQEEGYPLGLEWRFDAFSMSAAPGVVFWQATITNRSADVYNAPGIDYDSLYVGLMTRHGRANRTRVGFDLGRGTVVFNEIGHTTDCDQADNVPGNYSSNAFTGQCTSGRIGFTNGASAIVFLKSPIGDLRYKQFGDATSPFNNPTSTVRGDTLTYNIGRMCGESCVQERFATPKRGFGMIAAREALAMDGQSPASLAPFDYWSTFHPVNRAPYADGGPRVDVTNPRAGGGFNYMVPAGWRYETRPASAPVGTDTLFLDGCAQLANACTGIWIDSLPDGSLNFTRNATWIGAGPFRLAAGETRGMILAIVAEPDSAGMERSINAAISLYQGFFVGVTPPPAPRVVSTQITGGTLRQTSVTILLDNRTIGYVDPFLTQLANRYRSAPATTVEGRLQALNRLGPTRITIADSIDRIARNSVQGIYVYKSCDLGRNYTTSGSPNLCTRDVIRDSLGVARGPAAYRLLPDTAISFTDGTVLGGQTYQYVFVPASRGVRLQLIDSTAAGRRAFDTTLVAGTSPLPTVASAPNIATVYVPASTQAGGQRARVRYVYERGLQTFEGDTLAYNGPTVTIRDSITEPLNYRLVFGDTVLVREYLTGGALDSTEVVVPRTATVAFTFATQTADKFSTYATPVRRTLDTLRFVRTGSVRVPILSVSAAPVTSTIPAPGREIRTTTLRNIGGAVVAGTNATVSTNFVGNFPQGVLVVDHGGTWVPVAVGNDFRAGGFSTRPGILSSPDFEDITVDVVNRPVVRSFTATANGGAFRTDAFWSAPGAPRIAGALSETPSLLWQQGLSRLIGTTSGEYLFEFEDSDWGPGAPFNQQNGLADLQQQVNQSLARRVVASRTWVDGEIIDAINRSLGTALTADSVLQVDLPFTVVNRSTGNGQVLAVMRREDKMYSDVDQALAGNPARYYRMGIGADTIRVVIPEDKWVPGEPLIFVEEVPVADTTGGRVVVDPSGEIQYHDTLVVTASRATLGCLSSFPSFCNALTGRGGEGYVFTNPNYVLHVRYAVPFTPEREILFRITPTMAGARVATVPRSALDSVNVVPNPYILFSNYEQTSSNEQRIMFTHLPPSGTIRIYTVTGQFVQQLTWTAADLRGNGDLYFNLLTREGTLMASGLYLYTVNAGPEYGSTKRQKTGRFIIIR